MKVKRAISSGKVGLDRGRPDDGADEVVDAGDRYSTMACPREGISFGRPTASRMAMISTMATIQLVTMLLVTGSGPILNSGEAIVSTP